MSKAGIRTDALVDPLPHKDGKRKKRSDVELPLRCFDVLMSELKNEDPPKPNIDITERCGGLFVTWEKRVKRKRYELRGCIGSLSNIDVLHGIDTYTIQSAFRDSRFSPVEISEVDRLKCKVSLLHTFEECDDVYDWNPDRHGIVINFRVNCIGYSATYLPDVVTEQGWTKREAIDSLVRKSGYRSAVDEHFRSKINVTRYQSNKTAATYEEYCTARRHDAGACE